jgi:hypothetical protein
MRGPHFANNLIDPLPSALIVTPKAETVTIETEVHQVATSYWQISIKGFLLGYITDLAIPAMGRIALYFNGPGRKLVQSEQNF